MRGCGPRGSMRSRWRRPRIRVRSRRPRCAGRRPRPIQRIVRTASMSPGSRTAQRYSACSPRWTTTRPPAGAGGQAGRKHDCPQRDGPDLGQRQARRGHGRRRAGELSAVPQAQARAVVWTALIDGVALAEIDPRHLLAVLAASWAGESNQSIINRVGLLMTERIILPFLPFGERTAPTLSGQHYSRDARPGRARLVTGSGGRAVRGDLDYGRRSDASLGSRKQQPEGPRWGLRLPLGGGGQPGSTWPHRAGPDWTLRSNRISTMAGNLI